MDSRQRLEDLKHPMGQVSHREGNYRASACRGLVTVALLVGSGCGAAQNATDSPGVDGNEYPVVRETNVGHTADGRPVLPNETSIRPGATCERRPYKSANGTHLSVVPPTPGLEAVAVDDHVVELTWSYRSLPPDCEPVQVELAVFANKPGIDALPKTKFVSVDGLTGSTRLRYHDFLPSPNMALATSIPREGFHSRTVRVLIVQP